MYPSIEAQPRYPISAPSFLPSPAVIYGGNLKSYDVADSLAHRGFNQNEADVYKSMESNQIKKSYLIDNLKTTMNHVFEDSAVSYTNTYQMNSKGEVVSHDGTVLQVDEDERGGFIKLGIEKAVSDALNNPNNVVLFYSPPGPVVFDNRPDNKFAKVKDYPDGQLYIMYSDGIEYVGGKKVNNVAVSVSPEGEEWIKSIMPQEFENSQLKNSQIEQIKYFITHPALTGKSIDGFMNAQNDFPDIMIFSNKDKVKFSLAQILQLIHQSLAGQFKKSHIIDEVLQHVDFNNITTKTIEWIYGTLAEKYMQEKGLDSLTLGGFCGGDTVSINPLSDVQNILSTNFRMITQGPNVLKLSKDAKDDPNLCHCGAAAGAHFHCPGRKKSKEPCMHPIVVGEGTTSCPSCGQGKTC